jgi:hypothetical protein
VKSSNPLPSCPVEKTAGIHGSVVTISLNTATRQAVLMIDGALINANEFDVSQYVNMDGEVQLSFGYTIEHDGADGIKERRHFFLPPKDAVEAIASSDKRGLALKSDDEKAKADTVDYLAKLKAR